MVSEDYVSFEIAKLLKENGFDGKCSYVWVKAEEGPIRMAMPSFVEGEEIADRETVDAAVDYANIYRFKTPCIAYLCPTHQMALKWLKETLGIYPNIITEFHGNNHHWCRVPNIYVNGEDMCEIHESCFETYEEAVENAIEFSLTCLEVFKKEGLIK